MKASTGRTELDAMIVEIELTLVSIIQGVALTVLIESSRDIITELRFISWPYVLVRPICDFYFLVARGSAHHHFDPVAVGVWAQLSLHRLRAG